MKIIARPLTAEAFAPFGEVLTTPSDPGRTYFEDALGNGRPSAHASMSMVLRQPAPGLPVVAKVMERHEFSSQTFIPVESGRWLVMVCPHATAGGPDMSKAQAFVAGPDQGVTYRMNTWHHGLTVLDKPARLAVFMWRDGTTGDEEFVGIDPITVELG